MTRLEQLFCQATLLLIGHALLMSPVAATERKIGPEDRAYWAFQKVSQPANPEVKDPHWVRNPIDAFVLARLEKAGMQPSPPADKTTLLRRAYLDLIGLPPSPQEVEAFLTDMSPKAFSKAVDRLLASPQYGERWARHWLDLARYAESEGFKADETRPNAWRYRDYVINAFNSDKPYDRFVSEQIAGDELWPDDPQAHVATAFNRHYPDESNARNLVQRRQDILNDITDATSAVFMGLTCSCARCHDHKYDPILQSDYYRLQAFFANTAAKDDVPLCSAKELKQYREQRALWEEKTRAIRDEMSDLEAPGSAALVKEYFDKYPAEIQAALKKPASDLNPMDRWLVWKANQYLGPDSHEFVGATSAVMGKLKPDAKKRWQELKAELDTFAALRPADLPIGSSMIDIGREAPKTCVLSRGVFDQPKAEVQPGFLTVLGTNDAIIVPPKNLDSTGRRTALAKILVDPNNPLTARVMVNRIWGWHFGRGIVATPSDFGTRGERPTHPELLDWLAGEFVRHGWSIKHMHRLILNSSAWQQASGYREVAANADPDDKWLWRFPRQRLEGETIRDSALAVAGLLNPAIGGPSVFPELPAGMPAPMGGWKVNADLEQRNRRSIYIFVRRNTRYPMFDAFDEPDPHESCPRRNVTTSPVQALTLLNSELTLTWAENFAGRVLDAAGPDVDRQIDAAFHLAYGRGPDAEEKKTVQSFFQSQQEILAERQARGEALALPPKLPASADPLRAATLVDFCHTLLNMDEFVYQN
ncbi:MAG: hypothetical protein JWQ04_2854 [Pedosphaera sp.]|nr:hypothetical protein [Pedosphaera sp.]